MQFSNNTSIARCIQVLPVFLLDIKNHKFIIAHSSIWSARMRKKNTNIVSLNPHFALQTQLNLSHVIFCATSRQKISLALPLCGQSGRPCKVAETFLFIQQQEKNSVSFIKHFLRSSYYLKEIHNHKRRLGPRLQKEKEISGI